MRIQNKYIIVIAFTSIGLSIASDKNKAITANNILRGVGTPPTIVSIVPADMATNISPTTSIIITFDESVSLALDDMAPLTDNSIIIDCSISGVQSYPQVDTSGVTIATIDTNDFVTGDVCTVTASAFWIHDEDDGNHFDGNGDGIASPVDDDFISTFTVGAGIDTPPQVSMVTPTDMAGNVLPNTIIELVFNEPVDIPVDAITIDCTDSGIQTFPSVLTTPVTSISYDPVDFTSGETCDIIASTFLIHDVDGFPDHLDGDGDGIANGDDFESSFTVGAGSDIIFINGFE